jgi:ribosomal protein S18 acetylase RimI-like enzyme
MDETTIREAIMDDVQELVRMNILFNGSSDSAEAMAARMTDPLRVETVIVAESDGKVVGFAALRVVPCVLYPTPHAELTELYVKEEYRQRGIGRHLVHFLEKQAMEKGAESLIVQTGLDNQPALSLYRKMGFADYDITLQKSLNK